MVTFSGSVQIVASDGIVLSCWTKGSAWFMKYLFNENEVFRERNQINRVFLSLRIFQKIIDSKEMVPKHRSWAKIHFPLF